ncbi:MAG: galactose-1-phosphate uridylyltransferase [Elainellaceae cyanobacterium]
MHSGQIRLNKATREWVIYAPSRRQRPRDFQASSKQGKPLTNQVESCPFCPQNEHQLPSIIAELPDSKPWQTRVVPNKYPALTPDVHIHRAEVGMYLTMPSYGQHEVIIESPDHHKDIATMSIEEVEILIETYHQRYLDLMQVHQNMMVILFRNHGDRAGASLSHPHSQIIVTGMVPHHIRWRESEAQRYFDDWGQCVYCDIMTFEQQDETRIIFENSSFLAFVPYAAEVPFEIWIMPKQHQADFGSITPVEKSDFARILQQVLATLGERLHNPDYNYIINTAARYKAGEPQLHWYCQIRPRLTTTAGFEIGSGISINPSLPEIDAEFLLQPLDSLAD